jgi:AcrR family transcriptional regulator
VASKAASATRKKESDRGTPLDRDWIAAARAMLIEGGAAAVQINPLATRLGVTRGGFYWRFRNRQDLLDHLIADWENTNTRAFLLAIERAGTPQERYRRMVRMFIDERDFNPALDAAIRQWGSVDPSIGEKVSDADNRRIDALTRLFRDAGQDAAEAMVRARVVYFHQVGYYALGIRETRQRRRELAAIYDRILTGF